MCHVDVVKSTSSVFEHVYSSSIVEGEQNLGDGFFELVELVFE